MQNKRVQTIRRAARGLWPVLMAGVSLCLLFFVVDEVLLASDGGPKPIPIGVEGGNHKPPPRPFNLQGPGPGSGPVSGTVTLNAVASWYSGDEENTESVAWGDVDRDGDLDLVVGNSPSCTESPPVICTGGHNKLYLNEDGIFSPTPSWVSDDEDETTSVALGDIDGDGDLDLAVGNVNPSQGNKVYLNTGSTFKKTASWVSNDNDKTTSVAWADVDGDSDLDLAVGNSFGPNKLYLNENGMLQTNAAWVSNDQENTEYVAWGDADNDGDLDLAVGNWGAPNKLYLNQDGTLDENASWQSDESDDTMSIAWADADGDGNLDLAVGNLDQSNRIYYNIGGTLENSATWQSDETDSTASVAWADVDSDGELDLAVGNLGQANRFYLNDGGVPNTSASWISSDADDTLSIAWADIDGDGDLDLAVGTSSGQNQLYVNQGGTFQTTSIDSEGNEDDSRSVAWADADSDNDLDLAAGNWDQPNKLYRNENGTLSLSWQSNDNDSTSAIAWADVDGDGDLDLAVTNAFHPNKLYLNDGTTFNPDADWLSDDNDVSRDLAWGDVDLDGDLDLAVANNGQNKLYVNDNGTLQREGIPTFNDADDSWALAWADFDSDGDLDLAVGNNGQNKLYLTTEGIRQTNAAWVSDEADFTQDVAWADIDGDGDLDLAAGNRGQNRLYLNENGTLRLGWSSNESDQTTSVAWADIDSDGDYDLVVGNENGANQLYLTEDGMLQEQVSTLSQDSDSTFSLAWGDLEGDGNLDLAVGNNGLNRIYANKRPAYPIVQPTVCGTGCSESPALAIALHSEPVQSFNQSVTALAPADFYAVPAVREGPIPITYTLYHPESTPVREVRAYYSLNGGGNWEPAIATSNTITSNLTTSPFLSVTTGSTTNNQHVFYWDVLASGFVGQSDNVVFRLEALPDLRPLTNTIPGIFQRPAVVAQSYPFRVRGTQIRVYTETVAPANGAADALVYRLTEESDVAQVYADQSGVPFRTNDEGYLQGKGEVAIGDELITLWPLPQTPVCNTYSSSDVPQQIASNGTPLVNSSLTVNHMGRVVDVNVRQLSGSHSYMGDLSISLESPEGTKQEIMARACGNADDFDLDFDDQVELGAWPCPPTNLDINERTYQPSNPLSVFNDENSNGVWTLSIQDDVSGDGGQLDHWALELCTVNPNYTLYHINATPINNGLRGDSVEVFGTQELTVSAPHPLLLFHLDISLEWDASTSYLESLKKDIQRASEIFFDLSNGQAALGEVTVYQNKEKWEDSHVIVHAANNVRPSASMGGLVVSPTQEIDGNGQVIEDAYLPGQLSMGPTWGRFGEPNADLGEDWPRALAHELGHYLFFLPDNYLGIADGKLIATDCDGSVMTDAYPEEYSEYLTSNEWNGDCLNTVAEQATGRTDWETITHFYPQLRSDNQLRGPNSLPIQAQVSFPEPTNPVATLQAPFFTLRDEDGKRLFVPQGQGEGYLFKNWDESNLSESYVIPLGSPVGNQINARGAAAGDRLCVYDHSQDTVRLGCTIVEEIEGPITLNPLPNWRPQIRVSVLNTLTLDIEVTQPLTSGDLYVQILPSSRLDSTTPQISTVQQLTRINDNTFGAQVTLPYPTGQAFVRVWVEGSDPPQEAMSQFFLGSGWGANRLAWGANRLAWGANRLAWGAPVASGDGQVMILNLENIFADTGTSSLQSLNTPPLMPVWLTPVGQAYRFEASEQSKRTIAFNYLQSEVPGGETYEHLLRIYYSPDEGQSWQRLETEFNQQINLASATMPTERRGEGIYALLSTIEIPPFERRWNLFGYPVPGSRPLATGLASIEGLYTSILTYEPFDKLRNRPPGQGRWLLYDKRVISQHPRWAPLINDLTELEFGRGYWIYATEPITLYLGLPDDNDQNNQNNRSPLMGDLEAPPTTFYGPITGPLAPSVGTPITAMINGVVCGRSTVQEWERAVAYKIQVSSDTGDGCGETDDTVVFALDGQLLPTSNNRLWDNSGAQYHTLQAIEDNNVITLYLPLIRNGSGGLYLPLLRNSD